MSAGNLEKCLPFILRYEGGFSIIRSDPGNWTGGRVGRGTLKGTMMGIAASTHPNLDIPHLILSDVTAIYRREYWGAAGCETLPVGLDLCNFDAAVNSGVGAARRWLAKSAALTLIDRIHLFSAARMSMLRRLGTFQTFGKGWSARVAGIEAAAVRMALGTDPRAPAIMIAKSDAAKVKASAHVQKAGGAGAGAGAAAVASHPMHGSLAITGAIVALGAITAAAFWLKSQQQTARADAFAKAAMEPV